MEQPSQPRRSREPGSAAPQADGAPHARPLPDGVAPRPSPTLQNPARAAAQRPAPPPPPFSSATTIITSPAAPLTLTLPTAAQPPSAPPPLAEPRAFPAHLGSRAFKGRGRLIGRTGCPSQGSTPPSPASSGGVFFPSRNAVYSIPFFKEKEKKKKLEPSKGNPAHSSDWLREGSDRWEE